MQNVIENFKNLCKIPHCSYQTEQMKEFLSSYAKDKGFKVSIDKAGNIHAIKGNPKICSKVIMIWFAWEKLQK